MLDRDFCHGDSDRWYLQTITCSASAVVVGQSGGAKLLRWRGRWGDFDKRWRRLFLASRRLFWIRFVQGKSASDSLMHEGMGCARREPVSQSWMLIDSESSPIPDLLLGVPVTTNQ